MTDQHEGLLLAYALDGNGGAASLNWDGVKREWDEETMVWVHLDYSHSRAQQWMRDSSGIDAITCEALLSNETRPRSVAVGDGLLVNLRGVNLHPDSDPEDMISLRLWIEHHRLITLRQRKFMAVDDVNDALKAGRGPKNAVGLLLSLAENLLIRAGSVINQLDEEVDSLEDSILVDETHELRNRIASTRRSVIGIRRFLAPQRDALTSILVGDTSWISPAAKSALREIIDQVTRYVEDLDLIRDRAAVAQEALASRIAEQANHMMHVLSMAAGIFLPLSLLVGLLGINVSGIPGANHPWAFWIVCGLIVTAAFAEVVILRWKKWL